MGIQLQYYYKKKPRNFSASLTDYNPLFLICSMDLVCPFFLRVCCFLSLRLSLSLSLSIPCARSACVFVCVCFEWWYIATAFVAFVPLLVAIIVKTVWKWPQKKFTHPTDDGNDCFSERIEKIFRFPNHLPVEKMYFEVPSITSRTS